MIMKRTAVVNPYHTVGFNPPDAVKSKKVGKYPVLAKSGGGMFFDEVLEYRVWCHPHRGAPPARPSNHSDYYCAFAVYAEALKFAQETPGAEEPLALVRQFAWVAQIDDAGRYERRSGERITEWQVGWLERGPRRDGDIEAFLATHAKTT